MVVGVGYEWEFMAIAFPFANDFPRNLQRLQGFATFDSQKMPFSTLRSIFKLSTTHHHDLDVSYRKPTQKAFYEWMIKMYHCIINHSKPFLTILNHS